MLKRFKFLSSHRIWHFRSYFIARLGCGLKYYPHDLLKLLLRVVLPHLAHHCIWLWYPRNNFRVGDATIESECICFVTNCAWSFRMSDRIWSEIFPISNSFLISVTSISATTSLRLSTESSRSPRWRNSNRSTTASWVDACSKWPIFSCIFSSMFSSPLIFNQLPRQQNVLRYSVTFFLLQTVVVRLYFTFFPKNTNYPHPFDMHLNLSWTVTLLSHLLSHRRCSTECWVVHAAGMSRTTPIKRSQR